jgi:hypothetical protein
MSEWQHWSERLHCAIHDAQCQAACSIGKTIGGVLPCPSAFAHNEVSCSNTDFLYKYYDPGFQWNSILVLPIYQVNSVDHLTCTALVVGWLGFPILNHCQGHLQTSRLLWLCIKSTLASFTVLIHHPLGSNFCHILIPCTKFIWFHLNISCNIHRKYVVYYCKKTTSFWLT